jgi:hypothetical protein
MAPQREGQDLAGPDRRTRLGDRIPVNPDPVLAQLGRKAAGFYEAGMP